jgi:drug/metabolite transporter (DMT)-like permease
MCKPSQNLFQVHLAVFLFGFTGLFGRLLSLSPLAIVFGRVAFATVALLVACAVWRLPLWPRHCRDLFAFQGLGVLLAAHSTTFFQSVQASGVAVALLTFATFPVFVLLLETLLLGERPVQSDVVVAGLALAGVAILLPSWEPGDRGTQGVFWGVTSAFLFALLSLSNRNCVRRYSGLTLALYQDAFAAVVLLPFVLPAWGAFTLRDLVLLLVLGILCTAVAHALFITSLQGLKARTASTIACLEPVYGSVLAAFLLQEIPSVRTVLGGLVVLGVAFYATLTARQDTCDIPEARGLLKSSFSDTNNQASLQGE